MEILLFGITRDLIGQSRLTVPAEAQARTVGELKQWLAQQYRGMGKLSSLAVAVNHEYALDSTVLNPADEIALIPPVSGG